MLKLWRIIFRYITRTVQSSGLCVTGILYIPIQTLNMYVESFHNVLETYYMERKPNKRVNALIVVLFTYKENTYWRHKQERIYATKYQSPNNNSGHTRGMTVVNEQLTVLNETNRKEKSQSKGKSTNTFDCFWLPNIIILIIIIFITVIVIIIIITFIHINPFIAFVNNILWRYMHIKISSHWNLQS